MIEYRRRVQAQEAEAAAAAALGAAEGQEMEGGGEEDYETPKGGGMVVVEDREGDGEDEDEEDWDEDAETVGSDEDDAEDDLEEGEEGKRVAAVLQADEPLSLLQEMAASQQRAALLMTQAPEVLLEEEEEDAGQPAGCSSYESVISLAPSSPAVLSPLPWAAGDPAVEVKLVEVKSRNDFLSDHQLAWITRFVKHAFPPRVHASGVAAAADAGVRDGAAPPCGAFELCHVRSVARK
jgi:hypothetical protein